MNVYEAMRYIRTQVTKRNNNSELWSSLDKIERVADAYDALAPDWANAPDGAQWVTIFDNGKLVYWECEPAPRIMPRGEYAWIEKDGRTGMARAEQVNPLPLGIDWRLCKWQRPEAK